MLRTEEEERQATKSKRMRQHLGIKAKLPSSVQATCNPCLTQFDLPVEDDYSPSAVE